jgi:hypothetical protein
MHQEQVMRVPCAFLAVCVLLAACQADNLVRDNSNKLPARYTLTWPNYDGDSDHVQQAIYTLNGQSLGEWHTGYAQLVERMRQMPIGSQLSVEFPVGDGKGGGDGYNPPIGYEDHEYLRVAEERRIEIHFPPFGSGSR